MKTCSMFLLIAMAVASANVLKSMVVVLKRTVMIPYGYGASLIKTMS